ncbi:hypothetical protein, partial [Hyphomicrobium methylovorum]|uniref:hypothetical protein n=1 Tax=Hyphomicrobium methylovorum TaxID=84 RepID=UPI0015E6E748
MDIQFLDMDGNVIGNELSQRVSSEELAALSDPDSRSQLATFVSRFIRWRGVFRRPGRINDRHFKYQYALLDEVAYSELADLLEAYALEKEVDAVIFSDYAKPGWLEPSVMEFAQANDIPWASAHHLDLKVDLVDPALRPWVSEAKQRLAATDSRPLVVIPAYRDGLSHTELDALLGRFGCHDYQLLSVIVDSDLAREHSVEGSWYRTVEVPRGASSARVDFFLDAPIEPLPRGDWLIGVATTLDEIQEMAMEIEDASTAGFWSLLADYGAAAESPVPEGR